jgi:hypothetical protein
LTESLAMALYHAGCELYRGTPGAGEIAGDLASGKVRNLQKHVVLGAFAGPAFEAKIETERGPGIVRFLITRHGLNWMEQQVPPKMLN